MNTRTRIAQDGLAVETRDDYYRVLIRFTAPSVIQEVNRGAYEAFYRELAGFKYINHHPNDSHLEAILEALLPSVPEDLRESLRHRFIGPLDDSKDSGVVGFITRSSNGINGRFCIRLFHVDPFVLRNETTRFIKAVNDLPTQQKQMIQFLNSEERVVYLKKPNKSEHVMQGNIIQNIERRKEVRNLSLIQIGGFTLFFVVTVLLHFWAAQHIPLNHWIEHWSGHAGRISTAFGVGAVIAWVSLVINKDLQPKLAIEWN